jgi:hypothetical protein
MNIKKIQKSLFIILRRDIYECIFSIYIYIYIFIHLNIPNLLGHNVMDLNNMKRSKISHTKKPALKIHIYSRIYALHIFMYSIYIHTYIYNVPSRT